MQWPKQYLIHFYTVLVVFFLGIVLPGGSGRQVCYQWIIWIIGFITWNEVIRFFQSGCLFCRNAHIFSIDGLMWASFYSVVSYKLWHEWMIHLSCHLSFQQFSLPRDSRYAPFPYVNGTVWNRLSEFRLLAKPPSAT